MGRARKISRLNWPDPCQQYPGTDQPCGYLWCPERDEPASKVESCIPKLRWFKDHSLKGYE
jgi:hypothetical protein